MNTIKLTLAVLFLSIGQIIFAQTITFDTEQSTIEWTGTKIGGAHNGLINLKSGEIEIEDNQLIRAEFVVDMNSITNSDIENETYNNNLVNHLKSDDFFGTETFPTAKLNLTTKGAEFIDNKVSVEADLTIKGITAPITFDLVKTDKGYSTSIEIDRSKYDVKYGSDSFFDNLGDKVISDIFTLNVTLISK